MGGKHIVLRWLAAPPLSTRMWRLALGRVGEAIAVARRLRGPERQHALVRACRLLVGVQAPGWRMRNGNGYKVMSPSVREFDRAEWAMEKRLAKLVRCCIGCVADHPLPEDPPRRRRRARKAGKRAK
jgi:hypothetical protein